ncbi:MAG: hypothetical protein QM742_11940 [Aquabacterium sp.]
MLATGPSIAQTGLTDVAAPGATESTGTMPLRGSMGAARMDAAGSSASMTGGASISSLPVIRQWEGRPDASDPQGMLGAMPGARAANATHQAMAPVAAPLPPNDFQRYVLETSGQALPLFGSGFFSDASPNFGPQSNVPVSPDYTIGPGGRAPNPRLGLG